MRKFLLICICALLSAENFSQVFSQTTLISGLTYPAAFTITPDQRFLVTLKGHDVTTTNCDSSVIKVFDAQGNFLNNFFRLDGDSNFCYGETGLLGICLDADYATNKYVYFYYNHEYGGYSAIRVVRLTDQNNFGANPTVILDIPVAAGTSQHVGGNVRTSTFFPGAIFVSIGDLVNNVYAQDTASPFGKILCIHTDGTIPAGNPFFDDGIPGSGNDDRIWSYGHRNPYDFTISEYNGTIYCTENGWNNWDEVNVIYPGENYGWPMCEGFYEYNSNSVLCYDTTVTYPVEDWPAPLPVLTGICFYTSGQLPTLTYHLLVADNNYGNIYDLTMGNFPFYDTVISRTTLADITSSGGLTSLMQGADGCIYAMKGGFTGNGAIYKLCPPGIGIKEDGIRYAVKIFPNPAEETLTISADKGIRVAIYTVQGKEVVHEDSFKTVHKPDVTLLEKGVYIIRCCDRQGNVRFEKVIVK